MSSFVLNIAMFLVVALSCVVSSSAQWVQSEQLLHQQSGLVLDCSGKTPVLSGTGLELTIPYTLRYHEEIDYKRTEIAKTYTRHSDVLRNVWLRGEGVSYRWYDESGKPRFDVILDNPKQSIEYIPLFTNASGWPEDLEANQILTDLFVYQPGDLTEESRPALLEVRGDTLGVMVSSISLDYPLVIDPLILCSFVGGERFDVLVDVEMDDSVIYSCGTSTSRTYPVTTDAFEKDGGLDSTDAVVTLVSRQTGKLLYSTYLVGEGGDEARALTVDAQGRVWIVGSTSSADWFVTDNAVDTTLNGQDGFVMCLSSNGRDVLFSTLLGGSGADVVEDVSIDRFGNVVVSGTTNSEDFPVTSSESSEFRVSSAFVVKFNNQLSQILYSRTIGGRAVDQCLAHAVVNNSVFLVGSTDSEDFPMVGSPIQDQKLGTIDGWMLGVDTQSDTLLFSTYLGGSLTLSGGSAYSSAKDIVARLGSFAVVVETTGVDFPVTQSALPVELSDGPNTLLVEFNADGSVLFSSYVGPPIDASSNWNQVESVDVFLDGYVLAGLTFSSGFVLTDTDVQSYQGNGDAFVTIVNPNEDSLWYTTLIGGVDRDIALGVATFATDIAVVGRTDSDGGSFPLVRPFLSSNGGVDDGFVVELNPLFRIIEPEENTTVCAGDTVYLAWEHTSIVDSIQVIMERENGGFQITSEIVATTSGTLALWIPNSTPGGIYTLRLTSAENSLLTHMSHVHVRVDRKPRFMEHPVDITACRDSVVVLESRATAKPEGAYRWQVRDNGEWTDVVGAISQDLPVATASFLPGESRLYRSVATNPCGSDTSNVAEVSVDNTSVTILIAGVHRVCPGEKINLSAVASQTIDAVYEWRYRIDNQVWLPLPETSRVLTFTIPPLADTEQVEITCTAVGDCIYPASNTVIFREFVAPEWVVQPQDAAICVGDDVSFSGEYTELFDVEVSDTRWQVFSDGEWRDTIVEDILILRNVPQILNGTKFRAIVESCAGNDTSDVAELIVATQHALVPEKLDINIPVLPTCVYSTVATVLVENTGAEPEVITAYRVGLSYDFRLLTELPTTIAPGSSTTLQIRFEPVNGGTTTADLTLFPSCGDPIVLALSGELAESPPQLSPTVVDLEVFELCANAATSSSIVVNTTDKQMRITGIQADVGVDVNVSQTLIDPAGTAELTIQFSPQTAGVFAGEIKVEYVLDDNPACAGELTYTYSGQALPVQISAEAEYVELSPMLQCNDPMQVTTLTITNTSAYPLPIEVEASTHFESLLGTPDLKVLGAGQSEILTIGVVDGIPPGTYEEVVTVRVGLCSVEYPIRVSARIEALGIVAVPNNRVVFNDDGTMQSRSVVLQRQPATPFVVTDVQVVGGAGVYTVSGIEIGDVLTDAPTDINIEFDGTLGAQDAELHVYVANCPEPFVVYINQVSEGIVGDVWLEDVFGAIGDTVVVPVNVSTILSDRTLQMELLYNRTLMYPIGVESVEAGNGTVDTAVFVADMSSNSLPSFVALLGNARADSIQILSVGARVGNTTVPVAGKFDGSLFTVIDAHPDQTIDRNDVALTVSPSPLSVAENFQITFDSRLAGGSIEILDLFGSRVYSGTLPVGSSELVLMQPNVSSYRTGLFFVRCWNDQVVAVRSFLVVQ